MSTDWNSILWSHSGSLENTRHVTFLWLWQIYHSIFANPIRHDNCQGVSQYMCQIMTHGSHHRHSTKAFAGIWSKCRCTRESRAHSVITNRSQNCYHSPLGFRTVYVILISGVQQWQTGSQICVKATAVAGLWSKFRCHSESSACVSSDVLKNPAQRICQSHLARSQYRR